MQKSCLIFGTSSSGKSTISSLLEEKYGYTHISVDDENYRQAKKEAIKLVDNDIDDTKYLGNYKIIKMTNDFKYKLLYDKFKTTKKIVFDDNKTDIKKYYIDMIVVLLYTSLEKMAKNLEARRKSGDPRDVNMLSGFNKLYVKTSDNDKNKIDKISLPKFIETLKKYNKYFFEDEKDLCNYAKNIFNNMNIYDNKEYYIKLKDNYKVDHVINTDNKSKEEILEEIYQLLK